jgi:hypothetical protein
MREERQPASHKGLRTNRASGRTSRRLEAIRPGHLDCLKADLARKNPWNGDSSVPTLKLGSCATI